MSKKLANKRSAVLVVDDEPLLRMVLVDAFTNAGYDVSEAGNAVEALAVLERAPDIGIVITDVQMPGSMDGLRLAHYIHATYPSMVLIVASGAILPGRNGLPVDAIFMPKPLDTLGLLKRVAEMLAVQN